MPFGYAFTVQKVDTLPLLKDWVMDVNESRPADGRLVYGEAYTELFHLMDHAFSNVTGMCLFKYHKLCLCGICVMYVDVSAIL